MEAVCWIVLAAAAVYVVFEAWGLWGSLHGLKSGTSIGVSYSTQGPHAAGPSTTSLMRSGSVITTISLVSSLFGVAAVWNARAFFGRLARGEVFDRRTLAALRGFAIMTLLMQLQPVLQAVVTTSLFASLGLSFGSTAWALLASLLSPGAAPNIILLGLLVAMVAVLGRANEVAEDHAAIV
jgi:hypothetical protein